MSGWAWAEEIQSEAGHSVYSKKPLSPKYDATCPAISDGVEQIPFNVLNSICQI